MDSGDVVCNGGLCPNDAGRSNRGEWIEPGAVGGGGDGALVLANDRRAAGAPNDALDA